jgi:exonuclease SbcC
VGLVRIRTIEIVNWMPFGGSHVLDLPAGAIAIRARYEDAPRRSNWAGKSALLEAVDWCLTGTHRKRVDDDLIHEGRDRVRARVVLEEGDYLVEVDREKLRGKPVRFVVRADGEEYERQAASDAVVRLLGLDAADYRATAYFVQDDVLGLVARPSGQRRQVVAEWLGLDAWGRVAARARARLGEVAARVEGMRAELAVRVRDRDARDADELAGEVGRSAGALFATREVIGEWEEELEVAADAELTRQDLARIERIRPEVVELREQIKVATPPASDLEESRRARAEALETLSRACRDLEEADRLRLGEFDGRCPVTCEACPVADGVRANGAAAERRHDAALEVRRGAEATMVTIRRSNEELEGRARAAARLRERHNALLEEGKRLRRAVDERGSADPADDDRVAELRRTLAEAREAAADQAADLREAQIEERRVAGASEWIEERGRELDVLEREARAAALAAKAAGPTGIPAAISEAAVARLEDRANALLSGTGLSIEFAWERETKKLSPECEECGYSYRGQRDKSCPACGAERGAKRSDELEILVHDGSRMIEDVRVKSGGAKVLVASAIRLAAGHMLRARRGSRCSWVSVDEPFGPLDAENREGLAATFGGMLAGVGLEQAFVVSHDAALLEALPHGIEIVRSGGSSRVEVVR